MNLYSMSSRYMQLLDQDEYTDEEMQELQSLHENIEDDCIERGKYIRNLEAERNAVVDAIKTMIARECELNARIEKQRDKLAHIMKHNNIHKITKSPLFPVVFKENPVSVDDYDKTAIPSTYWRTTEKVTVTESVDKKAVKEAIESGIDVPGARLVRKLKVDFKQESKHEF